MINHSKRSLNERLAVRLKMVYDGTPWYGKSMKDIISSSSGRLPLRALELLNHMIAWRNYVKDTLQGIERTIELNTEEDWPRVNLDQGYEVINALEDSQSELLKAIKDFDEALWHTQPIKAEYTYYQLCHGLVDHDIYHSAQIATAIKKHQ